MSNDHAKFWALLDRTRPDLQIKDRHVIKEPNSTEAWHLLGIYEVRRSILAKANKEHPGLEVLDNLIMNLRSEGDVPVQIYQIGSDEVRYGVFVDTDFTKVIGVLKLIRRTDTLPGSRP